MNGDTNTVPAKHPAVTVVRAIDQTTPLKKDPNMPNMPRHDEYLHRLQARLAEVADGRELEARAQGKPVSSTVAEIRALVAEEVEYHARDTLTATAPATDQPGRGSGGEISQPMSSEAAADGRPADWPASWHPVTAREIAEALIAEIRNALIPARHACRKRSSQIDVPTILTAIDRVLEMATVCEERLCAGT
jgi:hypothetical protein